MSFPSATPESPEPARTRMPAASDPSVFRSRTSRSWRSCSRSSSCGATTESGPDGRVSAYVEQSRLCAKLINKYGGHAEVLMLGDDAGLKGSTHIPFADMDNDRVAGLLDAFLKKAGLDGYQNAKPRGHWVWDN